MTELSEPLVADSSVPAHAIRLRAADTLVAPLCAFVLVRKLRSVRHKHQFISTACGAALVLVVILAVLLANMIFDWTVGLPLWMRSLLLVLDLCGIGWLIWSRIILPVQRAPDDGAVALMVEDARPEFHSRLISAIQLAGPNGLPPGSSVAIARRMIEQTTELAQSIRFGDVLSVDRVWRLWGAVLAATTIFLGLFLYGRPVSDQLLQRTFLSNIPVPRFTDVQVMNGPAVIARGTSVNFRAIARRVIPSTGTILVEYAGGQTQKLSLDRTDETISGAAAFSATLADIQQPFDYRVKLNDNLTAAHHVDVQSSPAIARTIFQVKYPPYTRHAPEAQSPDSLSVLLGSTLHIEITATKALKEASLRLVGTDLSIPLQVNPNRPMVATADLPVKDHATGISLQLIDSFGLPNTEPLIYPLKVIPDRPPTVVIVYPKTKEELATRKAMFLIGFNANDDFGVDGLCLHYRVDGGPITTLPINISRGAVALQGKYDWDMGAVPVPAGNADLIGSTIEYWLEATDANDVTGPGVSQSEHFTVRSVTEDEKRAQLAQRESEVIGSFGNTAADQQNLTNDVGAMVEDKPVDKGQENR